MKMLLISWMLLVLGVTLNSGHYIYKVEKEDEPAYEVESGLKGLVIVNNKYEKPSLMDILHKDLLERSFYKKDPRITERSFTNSHGLPFLEEIDNENSQNDGLGDTDDDGSFKEPIHLTDDDAKAAYKSKSYLFDQVRQRNDVPAEDFIERKKRQAEIPYFPQASKMSAYMSSKKRFAPPHTYGMNLNSNGGYVWNNLNNRPSLYEVSQPSNGFENTSENPPATSEAAASSAPEIPDTTPAAPENADSGSSEDIYVNINRPAPGIEGLKDLKEPESLTTENTDVFEPRQLTDTTEANAEKLEETIEVSEAPIESVSELNGLDKTNEEVEAPEEKTIEVSEAPIESITELNGQDKPDEEVKVPEEKAIEVTESPVESVSELNDDKPEVKTEEPVNEDVVGLKSSIVPGDVVGNSGEAAENAGDKVKEMPDAPTLPPLNYDGLPDYIRQSISTTEKLENGPTSSLNLQPSSEDKEVEGIVTPQPVEDIPKTYGMNLTSGSGKVWNDLVNPPVSYEVGSTESNQLQDSKETTQAPDIIEPSSEQPATVTPTEPEKDPANPEDTTPVSEATEQPENVSNEPDLVIPGTETNDNNPTEIPTTSGTPEISETTELPTDSETVVPIIEPVTEEIGVSTDIPEIISTTDVNDDGTTDVVEDVTTVIPAEEPEGSGETGEEVAEPAEQPIAVGEKPDIMSELLKSEQFWEWLGEWMASYSALLEKHIRKIAVQEICNARHDIDVCPLNKPEDSGSIIKDGTITINGKEIDLNDNLNLKRGNKGHSVDATTIYGNSVGNDKVTNVFIFNPNNAKDILEGLKPENNSNVNIVIEEHKEEGRSFEATTLAGEENKDIVEDKGIEDRKDGDVPKEFIEVTTEKPVEVSGESKDGFKLEGVKGVENVTEAVKPKDETTEVNLKEVTTSSGLGVENVTETKLKVEQ